MNKQVTLLTTAAACTAVMIAVTAGCNKSAQVVREETHWEYENPDWQRIGYAECGTRAQSPVNIDTSKTILTDDLPPVQLSYAPFHMNIVDNGHTIQVNATDNRSTTVFNGIPYTFAQFHFHHRSEHTLNGDTTPLELHIVHKDAEGNILVYALMIASGAENAFLKTVFDNIPAVKKTEIATGIPIDLNTVIPARKAFYTYTGSLTTPPCTHAVQFVLFKEPLQASPEQIAVFAGIYPHNARPVQPLSNRFILETN